MSDTKFTPDRHFSSFDEAIAEIRNLYGDLLFVDDSLPGELPPIMAFSEQEFLLSLSHLQQAERHMKLAHLYYMRGE